MGTSQSFKLNSGPNWSKAKRAMTSIVKHTGNPSKNYNSLMHGINNGLGSSLYRGGRSRSGGGRSYSFGKAGGSNLNNFISFISGVSSNGLDASLDLNANQDDRKLSPEEYIELILQKVTSDNNSNLDDDAATVAMDALLHDIIDDCENGEEIEERLKTATQEDKVKWIISYEVKYIMEYSAMIFQSHIFDKEGNPDKIRKEIENWLHKEVDERFSKDLSVINLESDTGKEIIDQLTSEILDIWKPE